MRTLVVVGLALPAALASFTVARGSDPPPEFADRASGYSAADVAGMSAESDGAPIYLPRDLPDTYGWVGENSRDLRDGAVLAITTAFTSASGKTTVEICARGSQEVGLCQFDSADHTIARQVDGYTVLIHPVAGSLGGASDVEFWTTVPLTTDYTSITWLAD